MISANKPSLPFAYTYYKSLTTSRLATRPSQSHHFYHMAVGVTFLKPQTDRVTSLFDILPKNHFGPILWHLFPLSTMPTVYCMPNLPGQLLQGQHSSAKDWANCLAYNRQLKRLMEEIRTQLRDHLVFKGREMKLSICFNIQKVSESFGNKVDLP